MTEETPASGGVEPPRDETPSWPRQAVKAAAGAAWQDLSDTGRRWIAGGRGTAHGAWNRRPPRIAMVARLFLVAAAVAGAVSLLAQAGLSGRLPSGLDWRAAAAVLERDSRPGDAAVLAPAWAERARAELPARVPIFSLPRYADEPLLGVRRVWLVSLTETPHGRDGIARDIAARAAASGDSLRLGALTVTRYDLAEPSRALAFLPDRLSSAEVKSGETSCARTGPATLSCPGEGDPRIAREVRDVAGAPRACITAPPGSAATGPVSLSFPSTPMGLLLEGGAGVVGRIPSPSRAPIRFAVQVDGEEVAAVELPAGAPTWKRFETRTGAMSGEPHLVTIVLSTAEPAGRTVCFDAWTVP